MFFCLVKPTQISLVGLALHLYTSVSLYETNDTHSMSGVAVYATEPVLMTVHSKA